MARYCDLLIEVAHLSPEVKNKSRSREIKTKTKNKKVKLPVKLLEIALRSLIAEGTWQLSPHVSAEHAASDVGGYIRLLCAKLWWVYSDKESKHIQNIF